MTKDEGLRLALEGEANYIDVLGGDSKKYRQLLAQPAPVQEPVAYDKTELNCFAQDLYDQKMREGKRGHYESMFHVIHQCVKKVAPPPAAQRQWVGLTDAEVMQTMSGDWTSQFYFARAIEAKLKEKNGL